MSKKDEDRVARNRIEADLVIAIKKTLARHDEEGCYWHPSGLERRMAKAAMFVLKAASIENRRNEGMRSVCRADRGG